MNKLIARLLACAAALLIFLPATATAAKDSRDIRMTFEVEDDVLVLKKGWLYTTPSNCQNNDHPGCYDFSTNELGSFELTLKKGDADCDDEASWKWHSVTLGGEGAVESPQPKPDAWGNISEGAKQDFGADPVTGIVNTTPDGKKRVRFEDRNDHAFSIWYKLAVERCGDGKVLEYDPRIDNRG